jgi:membrane protein DedA with SNARE-associated domain
MDAVATFMQDLIRDLGYPGLFLLIVLESTAVPVPSLLVMPFAGFLAGQGYFSLPAILAINSAGALVGSGLSYWFGAAGGKPILLRWGKYIMVRPQDIEKTEQFFEKYGARTIFIGRFLPVIRHIISIPAGVARMRLVPFFALTFAGASLWGGGLMVLGYQLGENWKSVVTTWKKIDIFVAALIVLAIVVVFVQFVRKRRAARAAATAEHTPAPGSDAGGVS